MKRSSDLRVGIVGLGRGRGFIEPLKVLPGVELAALCDADPGTAQKLKERFGAAESVACYADYGEMLANASLDAVCVATPIAFHAANAIAALERGIHVLGEVPAVFSVEEARALAAADKASKGTYSIGENAIYFKWNLIVREMVRAGLLGEPYYAEAEYLHELRKMSAPGHWRRDQLFGRDGVIYGTHSLGPVLSWMEDDRVTAVSCSGSGHHFTAPDGAPTALEDSTVMMCRTAKGRLIKIRTDFASPRPAINRYQLQGTKGAYESHAYEGGERDRVYLAEAGDECWRDVGDWEAEYFPERFKAAEEFAKGQGHDGADHFMLLDYFDALVNGRPLPLDVHRSLDMTLPGLMSERSIAEGGRWVDVPDSRSW
jgi:predicted dehydrogenase